MRLLLYLFGRRLRDNVVSDDVTITSSIRSDVIILGTNFLPRLHMFPLEFPVKVFTRKLESWGYPAVKTA